MFLLLMILDQALNMFLRVDWLEGTQDNDAQMTDWQEIGMVVECNEINKAKAQGKADVCFEGEC